MADYECEYDTPWEYRPSVVSRAGESTAKELLTGRIVRFPNCGLAAVDCRRAKGSDGAGSPSAAVWQYRTPTDDARPSAEYDVPWDLKNRKKKSGGFDLSSAGRSSQSQSPRLYDAVPSEDEQRAAAAVSCSSVGEKVRMFSQRNRGALVPAYKTAELPRCSARITKLETVFCAKSPTSLAQKPNGDDRKMSKSNGVGFMTNGNLRDAISTGSYSCSHTEERNKPKVPVVRLKKVSVYRCQPAADLGKTPPHSTVFHIPVVLEKEAGSFAVENIETANLAVGEKSATTGDDDEPYDVPWEFSSGGKFLQSQQLASPTKRSLKHGFVNGEKVEQILQQGQFLRNQPDLNDKLSLDRSQLSLNLNGFGNSGNAAVNSKTVAKQEEDDVVESKSWFHGAISRQEAEQRLSAFKEGAYLVRVCERNKKEFALSLKSARGYLHMKIQWRPAAELPKETMFDFRSAGRSDGGWILGYFSQPFDSVPKMVTFYSTNKLPIKGAEHMCLLRPVADRLL